MTELRVAIIGFGLAGRVFHGPLITATPGMRVSAIVTADAARRSQAFLAHPAAALLTSPQELWARAGEIDLVVVATANAAHVALATAAIDHGLAVVVDKPLAPDAAAAGRLVAHAERAGVLLTVFHNRRWDADQLLLRRLLTDGSLGTVLRCETRIERWSPDGDPAAWRQGTDPGQGGGLALDLASHLVDQVLQAFGPVGEVYAEIAHRRGQPGDDDVFLALTHAGGVISHLYASGVAAAPGPRLRVLGSEAALVVSAADTQEQRLRDGSRPDTTADWGLTPDYARPRLVAGERSVPLTGPAGDWPAFYRELGEALSQTPPAPPPVDPGDAVAGLRVLDAARVSAAERRSVTLD
jgi:scyllo-inositol 2-dehydrogenase (NADP+)